ncbi:MAG: MmgE/PrpD family protein [Deltaproteobacteria bacterium]|nr:MmgE/PrpD family protein [Deltaproteobacteria bacterium]
MPTIAETLAEHVVRVKYENIFPDTIHEIKRGILDTLGCCVGGLSMDKGRLAAETAKRFGGPPEATIIGTGAKVSCVNAVLANGESANAEDWSGGCAFHDVPIVTTTALALTESTGASGRDLLTAAAVGLEISGRIGRGGATPYSPITEGPDRGAIHWDSVTGMAHGTFGAAAAAGKLLRLDAAQAANAIGIAGFICPPQTFRKFNFTTPISMAKYAPLGWVAHAGVSAALMAQSGYTGDTKLFEGDYGYGRYTGVLHWRPDRILHNLRETVPRLRLFFKVYPMGRILPGAIDNLLIIMQKNQFQPEAIDRVTAKIHILGSFPCFTENRLETQEDYCFHAAYALSCAAHGIPPDRWHADETRHNPDIRAFMEKINIVFDEKQDGLAMIEDSQARPMWVEVQAGGKTFRSESSHIVGSYHPDEFRMTDEMLKAKFRASALRRLPPENVEKVEKMVFTLEKLENTADLMKWVSAVSL